MVVQTDRATLTFPLSLNKHSKPNIQTFSLNISIPRHHNIQVKVKAVCVQVHSLSPRAANLNTYGDYIPITLCISRTFRPFDGDIVRSVMT